MTDPDSKRPPQVPPFDWLQVPIEFAEDATAFDSIPDHQAARLVSIDEIADVLICPDSRMPMKRNFDGALTFPNGERLSVNGERLVLLPKFARELIQNGKFSFDETARSTPGRQYMLLSDIKAHGGDLNSPYADVWYRRHVFRTRRLTAGATGSLLDIGCDTPDVSRRLFPAEISYVGVEPSLTTSDQFCICGMAESLPFNDASFDNVALLTSLDHILDHHRAIDEARRVLRPGGALFLASLVWHKNASTIGDTVHFHHFRDWELQGLLRGLKVEVLHRYGWKNNDHRYGVYLKARKG